MAFRIAKRGFPAAETTNPGRIWHKTEMHLAHAPGLAHAVKEIVAVGAVEIKRRPFRSAHRCSVPKNGVLYGY